MYEIITNYEVIDIVKEIIVEERTSRCQVSIFGAPQQVMDEYE